MTSLIGPRSLLLEEKVYGCESVQRQKTGNGEENKD